MANVGLYGGKNMLDWSLKAANPATPAGIFIGLSLVAPGSAASSEVGAGSGYTRQSMAFAAAATPAGSASASNSTAATFGTFSSSAVINGIFVADTVSSAAGSMLWYGAVATARTPLPGDTVTLAAGALAITLS
jgi:hypothetical protein